MTSHLAPALARLTLPTLERYAARAERRAALAARLTHTALTLGLGPSLNRAASLNRDRQRTATWLREVVRSRRTAEGLCWRCGHGGRDWGGICRDCRDDYAD